MIDCVSCGSRLNTLDVKANECGICHDMLVPNSGVKFVETYYVEAVLRGLMYKKAKSMPSRMMNKKIREAAATLGITIEK